MRTSSARSRDNYQAFERLAGEQVMPGVHGALQRSHVDAAAVQHTCFLICRQTTQASTVILMHKGSRDGYSKGGAILRITCAVL